MDKNKKLLKNTIASLGYQLALVISGFILPKYIMLYFGSLTYGLVSSITQFLSLITFCELGIGAVIQAALFKPLAEQNKFEVSKIMKSAKNFFRKVTIIIIVYVVVLMVAYPYTVEQDFDRLFTALLIAVISCTYIFQYMFSITRQLLLDADQKVNIEIIPQIIAIVVSTVLNILLIKAGASILVVKSISALVFTVRPIYLYIYVKRHYQIDSKIILYEEPIKQKWNGIAQHISMVVLKGSSVIVLTLFSTLEFVTIYSVYAMVIKAFSQAIESVSTSITSYFGNLLASSDGKGTNSNFSIYEFLSHTIMTVLFLLVALLIIPFIKIYTQDITDINYNAPVFAILLTFAYYINSVRIPYHVVIKAAGHFKETQTSALIEAGLNIGISLMLVKFNPLLAVTIGMLVAMVYRTVYYIIYLSKNIMYRPRSISIKHFLIDAVVISLSVPASKLVGSCGDTYLLWIIYAIKIGLIIFGISTIINVIMCREQAKALFLFFKITNRREHMN